MSIDLGWWLLPLIVTVVSFIKAGNVPDMEGLFRHLIALIISLIAWLIYALIT